MAPGVRHPFPLSRGHNSHLATARDVARRVCVALLGAAALWAAGCHDERVLSPAASLDIGMAPSGSGDGQTGTVMTTLPGPLRVLVLRAGRPEPGATVTWSVPAGAGSVSQAATMTDAQGIAAVTRTLGPTAGDQVAEARLEGARGSPVRFTSTALVPPLPIDGLVVSNPVSAAGIAVATGSALAAGSALGSGPPVAYVSLSPGAYPEGRSVTISAPGGGRAVTALVDGGFDPVPIEAGAGDVLVVDIVLVGGSTVSYTLAVPAARPPIIVRTDPPPRKRDVPLNASLLIVFSEPIAGGSVAGAVQLYRGAELVSGTAAVLPGAGVGVAFTPTEPLEPNTDYLLVIAPAVSDLDGDALGTEQSVEFTTGIAPTGAAASIDLSPDTVYMSTTYQMTVTVRDTAGNALFGEPVAWSTSDPVNLEVSSSGLLTAHASGGYWVRAQLGPLQATALVSVSLAGPPAVIEVIPITIVGDPVWDSVVVGGTYPFYATVRDAAGNYVQGASVTWRSSDTRVATVAPFDACCGWIMAGVTGVSPGAVTITTTSGSGTGSVVVTVTPARGGSLTLSRDSATLAVEDGEDLDAVVRDARGDSVSASLICWVTSDPSVAWARISSDEPNVCPEGRHGRPQGGVYALSEGSATILAIYGPLRDTVFVTVAPRRVPISLTITPDTATLVTFSPRPLDAVSVDANGVPVSWRPVAWSSDNPAVATVDSTGTVRAAGPGSAVITAMTEGLTATATVTVPSWTIDDLSAGSVWLHTCGVTDEQRPYCWGFYSDDDIFRDGGLFVGSVPRLTSVTSGGAQACGLDPGGAAWCWTIDYVWERNWQTGTWHLVVDSLLARPVPGGLTLASLDAGGDHVCGLTLSGAAYCWGSNAHGQLGNGGTDALGSNSPPDPASGGLSFTTVSAGENHTCALTSDGAAYCWGANGHGELGDGTTTDRPVPVPVQGGQSFVALAAGRAHTCGLISDGVAYCWGANGSGELGDASTSDRLVPTPVTGGPAFTAISAGGLAWSTTWIGASGWYAAARGGNTCGLTASGEAWCWGENAWGQLGDGTTSNRTVPTPVASGYRFTSISPGGSHTCGVATDGTALCWGMEYGTQPVRAFPP